MTIYKIVERAAWAAAEREGSFLGAPIDRADGYIHFSTADQVRDTARLHFAGKRDLVLVAVDETRLGQALRWEPARDGSLFPHLYAPLPIGMVEAVNDLPLAADGAHVFPEALRRGESGA